MKTKPAQLSEMWKDAKELHEMGLMPTEDMVFIATHLSAHEYRQRVAAVRVMSGEEIKQVRLRCGLSQASLAHLLGMTIKSVSKWERGEVRPCAPALRILNTLAAKGTEVFTI